MNVEWNMSNDEFIPLGIIGFDRFCRDPVFVLFN